MNNILDWIKLKDYRFILKNKANSIKIKNNLLS